VSKFWHELSVAEQQAVKQRTPYTVGEFMAEYAQPDWCQYPGALCADLGCWSLFYGTVHSESDCGDCELRKRGKQ
jgi:hypothetical protein